VHALARVGSVDVSFAGDDLEGGGSYRRELEQLAARVGVSDRVTFLGRRDDVGQLLDMSHALVLPSVLEGLPIVVLEAMAHARAVIATAVGGTPEVVEDGETGLLVGWEDEAALAAALERLRDDRGLAMRLGREGRTRVEREFTLERMVERTLAVYAAAR
jgi:glycosyltransferase involved in cell wall biosynthesis